MSLVEVTATPDAIHRNASSGPAARPASHVVGRPAPHPDAAQLAGRLADACAGSGLLLDVQLGYQAWTEAMREQGAWINPAFDPLCSDIDDTNTGSVVVRDADGSFLACNAVRLYETESFVDSMVRGALFHRASHPNRTVFPSILPEGYDLSGRIAYSGGTLVAPAARGKRLALLTTRFVRLIGETYWSADWHAGHIFNTLKGALPAKPYGFQRVTPCMARLPMIERPQEQTLYLVELSRAEFLETAARDLAALEADGRQDLDDLALLA